MFPADDKQFLELYGAVPDYPNIITIIFTNIYKENGGKTWKNVYLHQNQ